MRKSDITKSLISQGDKHDLLLTFFPDSIIINQDFRIVVAGDQVTKTLGFKSKELNDKTIECLAYKASLTNLLDKKLVSGFFDHTNVLLRGKENIIECSISGFYLGLISDLNGLIILKVKFQNQVTHLHSELENSRNELDEFVYRTAHDLQGPLATVLGLISLIKMERPNGEIAKLIELIDAQTQKLNERLHNLHYLSEFAFSTTGESNLDCAALESKLRSTIEEHIPINCLDFHFISAKRIYKKVNAQLVTSMINHLVLHLTTLPNNSDAKLTIRIMDSKDFAIRITIFSNGFLSDYQLREAINQKTALYTNIVAYSRLINFFAAQKAAQRINAIIKIDSMNETRHQISIAVPHID